MAYSKKKIFTIIGAISILAIITIPTTLYFTLYKYTTPGPFKNERQWELVFVDEFDGNALNSSVWSKNYPVGWPNGGHTHNHQAYMDEDNVIVEDGLLRIRALNETHPDAPEPTYWNDWYLPYNVTAGAITSFEKMSFKYGYIEAKMKMPATQGFWPAFWTLQNDGGWSPEIDIHEWLSDQPNTVMGTYHWGPNWETVYSSGRQQQLDFDLSDDFHTYGVEWAPDHMTWYFDGKEYGKSFTNATALSQLEDQFILINLAIGGWAADPNESTVWPAWYETDYVKIWQLKPDFAEADQEFNIF